MVVQILGNHNIATQYQNIIVLIVNNVNVTELQMEIANQFNPHLFPLTISERLLW